MIKGRSRAKNLRKNMGPAVLAGLFFALFFLALMPSFAQAQDRTLYIYYTHTKETARITFRKNGAYHQAGLRELNQFLRDWRRNEPTKMDPALFDLLWQVYQDVGAKKPIHIVSAYRSNATNEMLRSRSNGVAKNSHHTRGQAVDFYIPGVQLSKLREAAFRRQVGGVGYYPTSGSPFVHLDTGNVRAWPRMTRAQLQRIFPDGKTLHLASDGGVISQKGRAYALAQWQKCNSVPCVDGKSNTAPHGRSSSGSTGSGSGRSLMDLLFGNDEQGNTTTTVASLSDTRRQVTSVPIAPVPQARSPFLDFQAPVQAPTPLQMPPEILVVAYANRDGQTEQFGPNPLVDLSSADALIQDADQASQRVANLQNQATNPIASLFSAYAPDTNPEPDAQRALQLLIERRNGTQSAPLPNSLETLQRGLATASLGSNSTPSAKTLTATPETDIQPLPQIEGTADLFAATFAAVDASTIMANGIDGIVTASTKTYDFMPLNARAIDLYAPGIDEISEAPLVTPQRIQTSQFAVMFDLDEADLAPSVQLGRHVRSVSFSKSTHTGLNPTSFEKVKPIFVSGL